MSTSTNRVLSATIDASMVTLVLAEIAETASETLELQEVFDRVATSVRRLIPFDNMGVIRLVDGERAVLHATTLTCMSTKPDCAGPCALSSWSPRWRPRPGPIPRLNDAALELDRVFPLDAESLEGGLRSGMWEPFRPAGAFRGGIWLCSSRPHTFAEEHQRALAPIAALLGSAVEHWQIWDADRRRRDRLDRLETVLRTLAESLDVREVFPKLSQEVSRILPHQGMVLSEVDTRSRTFRIIASAGTDGFSLPSAELPLGEHELERGDDIEIIRDVSTEIAPDTERRRLIASSGQRSWLRVPVWISGEVRGGLGFAHPEPARYDSEDAEIARRLADRIALMLSHQKLAEEARIAAESREKAARLEATVEALSHELETRTRRRIIGNSPSWKETLLAVGRVAPSDTTVMITGESGTGKEVISGLIHHHSPRAGKPFVAINCAALPEQLLESELFGHEKGAFTGAIATKIGRIEQASGGTLFLDEIGEMSAIVQAKFLRVLEEREYQRVGGTRMIKADVRIIAATNRDLAAAIARRTFREDLFYRLNVFQIHIAPLRERTADILPLAQAFLQELGQSMGRPAAGISREAAEWLLAYSWPGNVRELRNAIERAILLCDGGLIARVHLPATGGRVERTGAAVTLEANRVTEADGAAHTFGADRVTESTSVAGALEANRLTEAPDPEAPITPNGLELGALERICIERALQQSKGNKSKAARLLGLSRAQLYSRLEKHGIK